ncbi:MAG: helix-turn-helix transcriptional regulator [Silicimonas sp.]|nr:helix-turn-helix transcriptional regulator [Silicimonas sp.]
MISDSSLFAKSLRDWRAKNGTHGRMTQEELAARLEVSVDAISKYERAQSFIRGDLEHRLGEKLGWSRDQILACREDWEHRTRRRDANTYRVLDDDLVGALFDGSWHEAGKASIVLAETAFDALREEFAVNQDVFLPIYERYRDHWAAIMKDGQMVAKWTLPFILPEDVKRLRNGTFVEANLSADRIHQPILPGTYYGYCPALVVLPGHEGAASPMLSSFVAFLERLASRDVYLYGIGTVACTAGGVQVCKDLGMAHLCDHELDSRLSIWELSGAAVPGSIFGKRSASLRRAYAREFAPG